MSEQLAVAEQLLEEGLREIRLAVEQGEIALADATHYEWAFRKRLGLPTDHLELEDLEPAVEEQPEPLTGEIDLGLDGDQTTESEVVVADEPEPLPEDDYPTGAIARVVEADDSFDAEPAEDDDGTYDEDGSYEELRGGELHDETHEGTEPGPEADYPTGEIARVVEADGAFDAEPDEDEDDDDGTYDDNRTYDALRDSELHDDELHDDESEDEYADEYDDEYADELVLPDFVSSAEPMVMPDVATHPAVDSSVHHHRRIIAIVFAGIFATNLGLIARAPDGAGVPFESAHATSASARFVHVIATRARQVATTATQEQHALQLSLVTGTQSPEVPGLAEQLTAELNALAGTMQATARHPGGWERQLLLAARDLRQANSAVQLWTHTGRISDRQTYQSLLRSATQTWNTAAAGLWSQAHLSNPPTITSG